MTLHCTLFELQSKGFEKFRLNAKYKMHGIAHIQRNSHFYYLFIDRHGNKNGKAQV